MRRNRHAGAFPSLSVQTDQFSRGRACRAGPHRGIPRIPGCAAFTRQERAGSGEHSVGVAAVASRAGAVFGVP